MSDSADERGAGTRGRAAAEAGADDRVETGRDPGAAELLRIVEEVAAELGGPRRRATLDSSLERELGFDSLGRVELHQRVERTFDRALPDQALAAAETPRDLLRFLAAGSGRTATAELPAAAGTADGTAEAAPPGSRSLVEVLDWHAARHPDRLHLSFESSEGGVEELAYGRLAERALSVAAGLEALGVEHGQAVGLMLPSGCDYFAAFCGVLYAGGVPVPLYPPARRSQIEDHLRRQAGILRTALARVLVTVPEVRPLGRLLVAQLPELGHLTTVEALTEAAAGAGAAPRRPAVAGSDVAFLQFTSGSTGDPKGVVLTHDNLLANIRAYGSAVGLGGRDCIVSWLPLYHDMGLIGAWMGALYYGLPLRLMSPLDFLARPVRWLRAIHRYRGTASAAPNFAYELCLTKIADQELEGLDLSSWRLALNGAEAVGAETLRRFADRFAPYGLRPEALLPVYGLAECSLALAFPPPGRGPRIDTVLRDDLQRRGLARPCPDGGDGDSPVLQFVSCGLPLAGHELRTVDAAGRELGERREGRIQFRGPSATSGYFRNPRATRRLFDGDWLDSGDLGYLADGELYVTGRAKDVIIRAGRNLYPAEIETAVGELPGVRKGCVAAFGSPDPNTGTERLVVMAELRAADDPDEESLADSIRELTLDLTGTPADDVVLVPPRTVLKTSSGKIRRAASRELYERGGHGGRPLPAALQVIRLALSGALPRLRRRLRGAGELLYGAWVWLVVGLLAAPVWLAVVLLPGLDRRRRLARGAARLLARLVGARLRVEGAEHLDGLGACVVVANHSSYADGFALVAALPPRFAWVAKREFLDTRLAGLVLRRLGALFVERFDPERGVDDHRGAVAALGRGESLAVFPEGTFQANAGLLPFRLGAFAAAAESGCPVVPVALRGTRAVLRDPSLLPRRAPVGVHVGEPLWPRGEGWEAAVELRDAARAELLRHTGEPDLAVR